MLDLPESTRLSRTKAPSFRVSCPIQISHLLYFQAAVYGLCCQVTEILLRTRHGVGVQQISCRRCPFSAVSHQSLSLTNARASRLASGIPEVRGKNNHGAKLNRPANSEKTAFLNNPFKYFLICLVLWDANDGNLMYMRKIV